MKININQTSLQFEVCIIKLKIKKIQEMQEDAEQKSYT